MAAIRKAMRAPPAARRVTEAKAMANPDSNNKNPKIFISTPASGLDSTFFTFSHI
jgi:hypothetical protein